jgi:hypothetical protein
MTIEPFDLKQQVDQCLHRNSPLTRRVRNASMLVVLTLYSAHLVAQSPDPAASKGTLYQTISQLDADLFGAIEIGVHRFPHPYAQEHGLVGEAKFMNVWRLKDG